VTANKVVKLLMFPVRTTMHVPRTAATLNLVVNMTMLIVMIIMLVLLIIVILPLVVLILQ